MDGAERTDRTGAWEPWYDRFLRALARSPNVSAAARAAGVGRTRAYEHRAENPAFAAAWDETLEVAVDALEAAAFKRAGKESDQLLIFLLKAHRPERYADRLTIIRKAADEVKRADTADLLALLGYQREPAEHD